MPNDPAELEKYTTSGETKRKLTSADLDPISRVSFVDARNPENRHTALFNPESVQVSVSTKYGTLEPIGWSTGVQQYASTAARTMSITLHYSYVAFLERGLPFPKFEDAAYFFEAFAYANEAGGAPPRLIVVWPGTLAMGCIVKKIDVTFSRWDPRMQLREYGIALDLEESAADTFYSNDRMRRRGFRTMSRSFDTYGVRGALRHVAAGQPLILKTK